MKHLVMLGAGHAHVHLLSTLTTQALAGVQITLVAPYPRQLHSGMVPGYVAGHYTLADCVIALQPFLDGASVTWLQRNATGLDATQRTVTLDDGSTLAYDVLSINSDPMQDRQKIEQMMPGAREHALFLRPIEPFGVLWPQVLALAQQKPLRFTIIGGGAPGFELSCAVAHRLPGSSVTLLSGDAPAGADYPARVQAMVSKTLRDKGITVIQERAAGMAAGEVTLASGARLACDVPIIALGSRAPTCLQHSGLALDPQGFVAVDAFQRSVSHPLVFAAGDVATRMDLALPRSGLVAAQAGPPLAKNLRAVLAGIEPSPYTPPTRTLGLLSCGNRRGIAIWGSWSAQGRWVWWLKDRIDRNSVKRYTR